MGSWFFGMILSLMVPIFLFVGYLSTFMEKVTGSTIPNALIQAILLGFIITTLSPLGNFFGVFS